MRTVFIGLWGIAITMNIWGVTETNRDVENEILIKFKAGVPQERMDQLMKEFGLEVLERYSMIENLFLCRTRSGENRTRLLEVLNQHPDIDYAEANQKVEALNVGS